MRRPVKNRNIALPDKKFESERLGKFINYIMSHGKRRTAERIVYSALDIIKEKLQIEDPLTIFDSAIRNAGPSMEVRSRRVGGANYQVPREVRPERKRFLAMKWIIESANAKSGSPMDQRLATEIMAAHNNEGDAIKKRENTHKMAEANKAFAHFAW